MVTRINTATLAPVALCLAGLLGVASPALAECEHPAGPVAFGLLGNVAGGPNVNVSDAICAILIASAYSLDPLGALPACAGGDWRFADIDCNGQLGLIDVLAIVHLAISHSLPAALDAGGDGCVDTCVSCAEPGGGSCLIGSCVPEGQAEASDPCQLCQPDTDATGYSDAPESWPCGGGQICQSAVCAPTVPSPPQIQAASPEQYGIDVAFSAPLTDGGSPVVSYRVDCTSGAGPASAVGTFSPITLSGLQGGVSYSCAVVAINGVGESAPSSTLSATPTSCDDGIQNGPETGVDCGGGCPSCTLLGGGPDLPAKCCLDIANAGTDNGNGLYWIELNSGVTQLYCHFSVGGTDGGTGWTRVGALDGSQAYCTGSGYTDLRTDPLASAGKIPDSDVHGIINNTPASPREVMYYIRDNNRWLWHSLQNASDFATASKHTSSSYFCSSWHCFGGGTDGSSCGGEGDGCPVTAHGTGGGYKKIYLDSWFSAHKQGLHLNGSICGEPNYTRASAWVLVR